jgi:hypothetical protein
MKSLLAALFLVGISGAAASARPLTSRVVPMDPEPALVVAPLASGTGTVERYRGAVAAGAMRPVAGAPQVLLIRLPDKNSPDTVAVVAAGRSGNRIRVRLETRRFTGRLAANVVDVPLVEIELGALPAGRYEVRVDETVLEFDQYSKPQDARNPRRGMGATLSFAVQ